MLRRTEAPHDSHRTARRKWRVSHRAQLAGIALGAAAAIVAAGVALPAGASPQESSRTPVDAEDQALAFDPAAYTTITVTIDGTPTAIRWYKEICYVAKPVLVSPNQVVFGQPVTLTNPQCGYQSMNVFVPESSAHNQKTAQYLAVNNAGWFASYIKASVIGGQSYSSATSNVAAALKAGYVYIDVATRGRQLDIADGTFGKAPSEVVDAKAAVRYLRLNDGVIPGSAERIVVNGTSGGGGLGAILGASGNSSDYLPYLAEIGAAGVSAKGKSTIRDDILAVNAYCPITDLGNADIAYEWLFTALGTRAAVGSAADPVTSAELAAKFAAYEKSLGLRNSDGRKLTIQNMLDTIKSEVIRSAETFMKADPANVIPDLGEGMPYSTPPSPGTGPLNGVYVNDWIDVDNAENKVISVDMTKYLTFVATQATLKLAPAFDQTGVNNLTQGESNLFGTASQPYSNFTEYSWNHNSIAGDGIGLDDTGLTWAKFLRQRDTIVDEQLKLLNPMQYIGTGADTAPYWYIRTGTRDRDTSFTVSLNLDRALQADRSVEDVNYRLAWDKPHSGNYDVPEAMAWIAKVLADADRSHGRH